jgi:thymidylate synthase (FAD)
VQQCARESLPNCTEAPIVVSMNARSWRHFVNMRASSHAEPEIRRLTYNVALCLTQCDPSLWQDIEMTVAEDGTGICNIEHGKV